MLAGIEKDDTIKQIVSYRQNVIKQLQCEVTRVISRMVRYRVDMIPERTYKQLHQIGCNRQDQDNWNGAEEMWELLARREWKVLVFHDQRWTPGTCEGVADEKRGKHYAGYIMNEPSDPEAKLKYEIKIGDQVLKDVDRGLVIIRSEVIIRLQNELDEIRRDLKTLVAMKETDSRKNKQVELSIRQ